MHITNFYFSLIKFIVILFLLSNTSKILAASPLTNAQTELNRHRQEQIIREQQIQQKLELQMNTAVDVMLDEGKQLQSSEYKLPQNESPCFAINHISLEGEFAEIFKFALNQALLQLGYIPSMCIGIKGIESLAKQVQNAIIERGYITTRITIAPQNLNSGTLKLNLEAGRINQIKISMDNAETTHAKRISAFNNEFPMTAGDILNLRDLEQGLENFKRVPTVETDIQIVAADKANKSDIIVQWRQRKIPFRLSLGFDNSGSKSTGKYQGSLTLSVDNPLGLSDLFYFSINQGLGNKPSYTDRNGNETGSSTNGYSIHYSAPFGNWLWAFNHNYYRYHQAVAGAIGNYDYNGESYTTGINLTRMLYRNAYRKTTLTAGLWQRQSSNYINDAEIKLQRRRTAGWSIRLNHKEYIDNITLAFGIGYKRGTGFQNSLRAPEESFGEGTSRMQIITADADINLPFNLGKQNFSYDSQIHLQWNQTPLVQQDKISIGTNYNVRGFDGQMTLSAERGGYWRNTFGWQYIPSHQFYIGIDTGKVSGRSRNNILGQSLTGLVVGFKGQLKLGGLFSYDVYAGKPLQKPEYFKTDSTHLGFNLYYSF